MKTSATAEGIKPIADPYTKMNHLKNIPSMKTILLSLLIAVLGCTAGFSQTTTRLLESGNTGSKFDLVIIGDGFAAGNDQTTFNNFVNNIIMQGVFQNGPVWESLNAFNIYRVNLVSAQSGVTQVDTNGVVTTARNTALDYHFSGVWKRCWMEYGPNTSTNLNTVLNASVPGWDYVFIVLNEPGFGGCGGGNQLAITSGVGWTVGAHELGHMIGGLADEYCGNGSFTMGEPGAVNVTINTNRSTLKWREYVNPNTPLPTGSNARAGSGCAPFNQGTAPTGWSDSDDAGLFEGAAGSFDDGIYRPVINCRMNGNSPPFCPVCYNQMKTIIDPFHEYTYQNGYSGDFTGDGLKDVVIHNANSLALYRSVAQGELEPIWVATGEIPIWDDFRPNDHFYPGDFNGDGKEDLFVYNYQDWSVPYLGLLQSNGNGFDCVRMFTQTLPGWGDMKPNDQFMVADFNGDRKDDLYVFNGRDWSMGYLLMLRSTGNDMGFVQRFDDVLPGWGSMLSNDQFYVGDFNNDSKEDLYVFNGRDWSIPYLEMLRSTGNSLAFTQRFDQTLPGWGDMKANDQFFVADFNADGRKDIYVFNGRDWSMEYLEMLRSTGSSLAYVRRFDDSVPGWDGLAANDRFFVADINGDKREDLYVYNANDWVTEYIGTMISSGSDLSGGWQDDWVGNWNLGAADQILVGNFAGGANWDDVFIRNSDWFGMLRSSSASVYNTAIYPKWIHRDSYHSLGWW